MNDIERTGRTVVGDPLDESTDVGSLTSERQWKKVAHYVELAPAVDAVQQLVTVDPHDTAAVSGACRCHSRA